MERNLVKTYQISHFPDSERVVVLDIYDNSAVVIRMGDWTGDLQINGVLIENVIYASKNISLSHFRTLHAVKEDGYEIMSAPSHIQQIIDQLKWEEVEESLEWRDSQQELT